jgi:hypothetical protein
MLYQILGIVGGGGGSSTLYMLLKCMRFRNLELFSPLVTDAFFNQFYLLKIYINIKITLYLFAHSERCYKY